VGGGGCACQEVTDKRGGKERSETKKEQKKECQKRWGKIVRKPLVGAKGGLTKKKQISG